MKFTAAGLLIWYIASSAARKGRFNIDTLRIAGDHPEAGALIVDTLFAEEVDAAQSLTQGRDIRLLCGRLLGATDDQKLIAAKAANDIFPARDSGESFADLPESCRRTDGRTDR